MRLNDLMRPAMRCVIHRISGAAAMVALPKMACGRLAVTGCANQAMSLAAERWNGCSLRFTVVIPGGDYQFIVRCLAVRYVCVTELAFSCPPCWRNVVITGQARRSAVRPLRSYMLEMP